MCQASPSLFRKLLGAKKGDETAGPGYGPYGEIPQRQPFQSALRPRAQIASLRLEGCPSKSKLPARHRGPSRQVTTLVASDRFKFFRV